MMQYLKMEGFMTRIASVFLIHISGRYRKQWTKVWASEGQVIKKGDHFILPCGYGNVEMTGEMELIASAVK